jgi:hypothetical protein
MSTTTAGFRISVRGRRIYLVDVEPTSGDAGISAHEAKELAVRCWRQPPPPSWPESTIHGGASIKANTRAET